MSVDVVLGGIVQRLPPDCESIGTDLSQQYLELLNRLEQLAAGIEKLRDAAAARAGLNRTDYQALAFIVRSQSITAGQLAECVGLTTGGITGVLKRLERSGYAVRAAGPDRRYVVVQATEKGRRAASAMLTALQSEISGIVIFYSGHDLRILSGFMEQVAQATADRADLVRATTPTRSSGGLT